jgi:hypothetical protein
MNRFCALVALVLVIGLSKYNYADVLTSANVVVVDVGTVGSGNGNLDLVFFNSSGERDNVFGLFNGDNSNNTLPNGGSGDGGSFAESYLTTAGELQQFLLLNFPDGNGGSTVNELLLILDLNESGPGSAVNSFNLLQIVLNPSTVNGNPDPFADIAAADQAMINQMFTGGTIMATTLAPFNLSISAQGNGQSDYAIFTGINPFSLNASDVLLFNFSMSSLSSGGETLFVSGTYSATDVAVPEPSTVTLLILAGTVLSVRRRRLL